RGSSAGGCSGRMRCPRAMARLPTGCARRTAVNAWRICIVLPMTARRRGARHPHPKEDAMRSFRIPRHRALRGALLAAALLLSSAALAGPPLLCHPFDTGGAASLPWGQGWNRVDARYDTARLSADTLALLDAGTPVIARMEALRRAAIYASADGARVRELAARLDARIAAAKAPQARALALFDAGYFAETLQDIARL